MELESIKKEVTGYLSELLTLTPNEREFLTNFKNKRYTPELLFDDTAIFGRLIQHPMAIWKLREA